MTKENRGTPIGEIIPDVLKKMGLLKRLNEGKLVSDWPGIVGRALAKRSSVRDVKEGVLFVEARNSVWMQEIRFLQNKIIERINEKYPDLGIKEIRVFIDRERGEG